MLPPPSHGPNAMRVVWRTLQSQRWLKIPLALLAALVGFMLCLALLAASTRPSGSPQATEHSPLEIERVRQARDVSFDAAHPERLPRIQRDVDLQAGSAAAWWPKGESPILKELVAEGK